MDLFSKVKPSLFIARPWDTSFAEFYEPIKKKLSNHWDISDGPIIIKEDQAQANRQMFISRNKQLYEMIVSGIKKSDVFVADVTNANANVMMELGIAIQLNKNVIIVTGQDRSRLPFDIQGFKAEKYDTIDNLDTIIDKELSLYLSIKEQNFDKPFPENHITLSEGKLTGINPIMSIQLAKPIKNLKLRIEYKFVNISDEQDWLGIHLRASQSVQPSELVYVRSNGNLEVVTLPTRPDFSSGKDKENKDNSFDDGFTRLELILEGNKLLAATSTKELFDELIQIESFGSIYLQANAHSQDPKERESLEIDFRNFEILNIDTTSPS